jgi:hypothetical protein
MRGAENFDISIDISAPPQRVWAVNERVERWPGGSVRSVQRLDRGPAGGGARIRQPGFLPATWEVTDLNRGQTSPVTHFRMEGHHRVEPIPAAAAHQLSVTYDGLLGESWQRGQNHRAFSQPRGGRPQETERISDR